MQKRTDCSESGEQANIQSSLKGSPSSILDCAVKDDTGLNDFQKLPSNAGISIPRVGIERFRIPLLFKHADGTLMNHDAEASMFVYLSADKTGVNMSRFPVILQKEAAENPVDNAFFKTILHKFRSDLRDFESESLIPSAELSLKFNYALKQESLKSDNWGWQYYTCELKGVSTKENDILMSLSINYEYSSTCPCSLSMAKQYEQDYREGKTTEGSGIATAHSQRSNARTEVFFNIEDDIKIEELVTLLRKALPTETQSLVKRLDEQAFAILNGENPIFVEHVARSLSRALDAEKKIIDWNVHIEHWESLHSHNAVAYISKIKS